MPPRAEDAAAHVDEVRKQLTVAFPGKEILIGETGWPSQGRMREGAVASRINQARFISEILERARVEQFRVNLFEAYDEPWKRRWEGTVGGYWGVFNAGDRRLKYPAGVAIGNYPLWQWQMAGGLAFGMLVFAVAGLTLRRRPSSPGFSSWLAVAISATTSGVLLGVGIDKLLYESFGVDGWLRQSALLAAAIAAPLLTTQALMSERPVPAFLDILGPAERRTQTFMTTLLGVTLIAITLAAVETSLGLVFDGRWRDFPFAALTMAVVPYTTLSLLPSIGRAPDGRSRVRGPAGADRGLYRLQRRLCQLAVVVDLRGLSAASFHAVAGAKENLQSTSIRTLVERGFRSVILIRAFHAHGLTPIFSLIRRWLLARSRPRSRSGRHSSPAIAGWHNWRSFRSTW